MAKVIYLYHSGFAVEPDPYVLVFDVCVLNMYTPPKENGRGFYLQA